MISTTFYSNCLTLGLLTAEAQAVVTMRVLGMAGLWPVTPTENRRMFSEKSTALVAAQVGMTKAAMSGHSPSDVVAAGLRPFRQKTRSNARRLTRRATKSA